MKTTKLLALMGTVVVGLTRQHWQLPASVEGWRVDTAAMPVASLVVALGQPPISPEADNHA